MQEIERCKWKRKKSKKGDISWPLGLLSPLGDWLAREVWEFCTCFCCKALLFFARLTPPNPTKKSWKNTVGIHHMDILNALLQMLHHKFLHFTEIFP